MCHAGMPYPVKLIKEPVLPVRAITCTIYFKTPDNYFMRHFLLVFLTCITVHSSAQDTTWVQTFTFDTVNRVRAKFFFPTANESYRKILMYTTLKCYPTVSGDNKYPCGEWDKKSSTEVITDSDRYEIGRAITPYGINLDMGNGRTWIYDVTDYYDLLQDTVDLKSGTQLELQDVRFAFIKGIPPAKVLRINQPWLKGAADFDFGDLAEDRKIQAQNIQLLPQTGMIRVRPSVTGHRFATSNAGGAYPHCCEFWENKHYLYINSRQFAAWTIFRNCGDNPLYPQGGTWTTAREGWCPGDMVHVPMFTVDPAQYAAGGTLNIDYGISPVPSNNPGMAKGGYWISLQVIEYGPPAKQNDAEMYDVLQPSDQFYYSRINPVCNNPKVVLRNTGKKALTSAVIRYGVSGGTEESYTWTGSLGFLEMDTVTLPLSGPGFWAGDGKRVFSARVAGINNAADEYALNDTVRAGYRIPDNYNLERIVVALKTNNSPSQNTLTVKDFDGNTVLSRTGLSANRTYNDTLNLSPGCYYLTLDDEGNDGLSFWANPGQGSGSLQLRNAVSAVPLKTFNPDFGAQVYYPFTIGSPLTAPGMTLAERLLVYPNPSNGSFRVRVEGYTGKVHLEIMNILGQRIITGSLDCYGNTVEQEYSPGLENGVYLIRLDDGREQVLKKVVIR